MRAFISYTVRDDILGQTELFSLREPFLDVFDEAYVDLLDRRSSFPRSEITERIQSSNLVILCCTPAVLASPWVIGEIRSAQRFRIPIYKLNIEPKYIFSRMTGSNMSPPALKAGTKSVSEISSIHS